MFKPTKAKVAVFLVLLSAIFAPMFFVGSGLALIVPVAAIFWLAGLADAVGIPVVVNGGVDAFKLSAPNRLGQILIIVGSAVSLMVVYAAACVLSRFSNGIRR
jgi:hypothetical protein